MGAVELVCVKIYPVVYCEVCNRLEDDDAFCRLIYPVYDCKMILKYQSGRKHEQRERHDETSGEKL